MVRLSNIEAQLKRIGANFQYWGRAEKRELCHILTESERIVGAINGRYEGGFAMLVATDQRLLLIDKKPWFLTVEDIRYDMIAEVDYSARLMEASVKVMTFNKSLFFRTLNKRHLRPMTSYMQQRVMDLRQHGYSYNSPSARIPQAQLPSEVYGVTPQQEDDKQSLAMPQSFEAHGMMPQQPDDTPVSSAMPEVQFDNEKNFLPRLRPLNPYTRSAVMMRRRVSRF